MKSIYERVLGEKFKQLHPVLQKKFSLHSESSEIAVGEGTMSVIRGGKSWMKFLFTLGTRRDLLFPERGENVPFKIINKAFKDPFGRETVAWIRRFHFESITRGFDATMVYSENTDAIIDYLGNRQRLISPLDFHVTKSGGLCIQSRRAYFWIGKIRIMAPVWASPIAKVLEEVKSDNKTVSIHVTVTHPLFGMLIEYIGEFSLSYPLHLNDILIERVYPKRFEKQE